MLTYACCPAFVIHCHTFALCGIALHNKRNGKVKVTASSTKFAYYENVNDERTIRTCLEPRFDKLE